MRRSAPPWAVCCSGTGRPEKTAAYLARERIVQITEHTVIDRVKIRRIIETAREDGYAISDEEAVAGGSGVAAPVRDATGDVIAALNIATVHGAFRGQPGQNDCRRHPQCGRT